MACFPRRGGENIEPVIERRGEGENIRSQAGRGEYHISGVGCGEGEGRILISQDGEGRIAFNFRVAGGRGENTRSPRRRGRK